MEKNFREVIRDIKEGEVWECDGFEIERHNCGMTASIEIRGASGVCIGFYDEDTFKLKRKEYTFAEAFEEYENGKEIQSVETNTCYLKHSDRCREGDKHFLLGMKEIRGKWYINN